MFRWKLLYSALLLISLLVFLSVHHAYPLGIHTISLVKSDIIYDIMLDAGHGGIDPGAIGIGDIYEKHYVLDIVLQMSEILKSHGLKVGLTRDTDSDVSYLIDKGTRHRRDLLGRLKLMNQAHLGISVHANAAKDTKESGALVFYMKDKYIDEVYAKLVLEELAKVQILNELHPLPRSTLLLPKAKPPVLLVEVGFMSNPTDLAQLGDPRFRTNVAYALCTGILRFIEWREGEQSELNP